MTDHFIYFFVGCDNYSTNFVIPFTLNLLHHSTFTPEPKYNYKQAYQVLGKTEKSNRRKIFAWWNFLRLFWILDLTGKRKTESKKFFLNSLSWPFLNSNVRKCCFPRSPFHWYSYLSPIFATNYLAEKIRIKMSPDIIYLLDQGITNSNLI